MYKDSQREYPSLSQQSHFTKGPSWTAVTAPSPLTNLKATGVNIFQY